MHAAVVRSFGSPPVYDEFPDAAPGSDREALVAVLASGLHPRVRSQASGSHYADTSSLPLVPGVDGVGRLDDGTLVYFVLGDTPLGAMAERTVADRRRMIALPPGVDPVALAASMNPGMSSWVALRRRADLRPGQSVLVLGATGAAGRMAVQVARHLGAAQVVAAGRDPERLALLPGLGADETVSLVGEGAAERVGRAAADVDVVLDYVWGETAAAVMVPLLQAREDRSSPLTWVHIGATAGTDASIPSAALRQADLRIVGQGQGSVSAAAILAELPELAAEITRGTFTTAARAVPLADVEKAWADPAGADERLVLAP